MVETCWLLKIVSLAIKLRLYWCILFSNQEPIFKHIHAYGVVFKLSCVQYLCTASDDCGKGSIGISLVHFAWTASVMDSLTTAHQEKDGTKQKWSTAPSVA